MEPEGNLCVSSYGYTDRSHAHGDADAGLCRRPSPETTRTACREAAESEHSMVEMLESKFYLVFWALLFSPVALRATRLPYVIVFQSLLADNTYKGSSNPFKKDRPEDPSFESEREAGKAGGA